MTDMSQVRDRIRQRLPVVGKSMKKLDEEMEVGSGFVFDFLKGRKKSIKNEIIGKLARELRTTEVWLLHGYGPEEADAPTQSILPTNNVETSADEIKKVWRKEIRTVFISSLDLMSGQAVICEKTGRNVQLQAKIVDPELSVVGNLYVQRFGLRQPLKVFIKRAISANGQETWFVIDAENPTP
jgi:hypothetical protein